MNSTSNIIVNVTEWFYEFFNCQDGLVFLNVTKSELVARQEANESISIVTPPVTSGSASEFNLTEESFQAIVQWIRVNVEREVYARCESCHAANQTVVVNQTNETNGNASGSAPEENVTVPVNETEGNVTIIIVVNQTTSNETEGNMTSNVTEGNMTSNVTEYNSTANFTSENYTLPSSCNFSTDSNDTVCCVEGLRSVCYNFTELTEFWDFSLTSTCSDVTNVYTKCLTPIIPNDNFD